MLIQCSLSERAAFLPKFLSRFLHSAESCFSGISGICAIVTCHCVSRGNSRFPERVSSARFFWEEWALPNYIPPFSLFSPLLLLPVHFKVSSFHASLQLSFTHKPSSCYSHLFLLVSNSFSQKLTPLYHWSFCIWPVLHFVITSNFATACTATYFVCL